MLGLMMCAPVVKVQAQNEESMTTEEMRNEINALKQQNADRELQEKNKSIWKRTKSFNIGLAFNNWKPTGCEAFTPNYGFMMGLTNTYYVHPNPIAGFIKFGIDATWFDLTYSNYKAAPGWLNLMENNTRSGAWDYDEDGDEIELDHPNLGSHQIDMALGVGVSATFAPFYQFDNQLNQLKGKVYCRFLPSMSMMLISEPDDTRVNYAFVPYITFGAQFSWKVLSLFVEGRWGSANYKIGGIKNDVEYDEDSDDLPSVGDMVNFDKISCKNYGVRFGIGLTF